jgi:hypothetical protein
MVEQKDVQTVDKMAVLWVDSMAGAKDVKKVEMWVEKKVIEKVECLAVRRVSEQAATRVGKMAALWVAEWDEERVVERAE